MSEKPNESKSLFTEWLEKLQQESWQLELLISGFALFGIYSSRVLIKDLSFYIENNISGELNALAFLILFIIKSGWIIFFVNLIIHVILRGLWIGAIGLRYVSQEIDYDCLNYSEVFTNYLKKKVGSYDDFIEKLEKICSVIFAFTFLLFALFVSLVFFTIPIILVRIVLETFLDSLELNMIVGFFAIFYSGLGFLVFIDLVTLGGFKRIKDQSISKIYLYIYRFYSFVTLSNFYRPLLFNFIDNSYTKKLFYLSIPYIFFIISGNAFFENTFNPFMPDEKTLRKGGLILEDGKYDDLRLTKLQEYPNEERKMVKTHLPKISLEHYHIKDKFSSVFYRIDKDVIDILEKSNKAKPYKSRGLSFALFGNDYENDKKYSQIEKQKGDALAKLYISRRTLEKASKKNKVDSINILIEKTANKYDALLSNNKKQKAEKTLNLIKEQYELSIADQIVKYENCFFYYHPHYNEQGIKCIFATDSLKSGSHLVKIKFLEFDKMPDNSFELSKDSISLPILKY
jgi:hypothetical protein